MVIEGKDYAGRNITETIALDEANEVVGVKPFASIDNIIFPARTGAGDTVSVGISDKLGLTRPIAATTDIKLLTQDGTADTVAASNATYGTVTPTTSPDGAVNFAIYYDTYLM